VLLGAGALAEDAPSSKAAVHPIDVARIERAIEARLESGQFMGSVLIARDGKALLSKGYGKASIADHIPNTPDTKFRLGSVTKQFTAASILLLEERGKLKVEDPISKYLPDAPPAWRSITFFYLLTHTSGIPNFTSFPDYPSTEGLAQTPEQVVARFKDKPLNFVPGTAWEYSNSGYVLLGYLIEKISGQTYASFVHDNLFAPLGMKDSGYDSSTEKIARHAVGYAPGPDGPVVASFIDMSIPFSAGALYSTTEDMLRWEQALFGGKVLKPSSFAKMTTPFKNGYAMGLSVRPRSDGGKMIAHNGGIEGFNTEVEYLTADKLTIIVLANLNGPAAEEISADIRKVAYNEPGTLNSERKVAAIPAESLDRLAGTYRMETGQPVVLTRADDHLHATGGPQPVDLYPQSATEFFAKTLDLQAAFESDPQGRVTGAALTTRGQKIRLARLSELEAQQQSDALAKKIRDQTPTPGSDAAVRSTLQEVAAGTPDYGKLGSAFAATVRQQLPMMQPMLQQLGAIKSVEFKGVGPAGADIFNVAFENGKLEVRIALDADGKVVSEGVRPLQ
jgi:CubicO group peptidase (beta-lactamase class C family)